MRGKVLIITAIGVFLFAASGFAATYSSDANVTVAVSTVFNFSLSMPGSPGSSTIDFGQMKYGDWKEVSSASGYSNAAVCKSNTGRTWYLKIRADGPLSSGSNIIPLSKFSWMSTYAGSKNAPYQSLIDGLNHKPASGYVPFTLSDELVYASALNDNSNLPNGTEIQFKYAVSIPDSPSPLSGAYTTTVTYTMTE